MADVKPWEETWVGHSDDVRLDGEVGQSVGSFTCGDFDRDEARARLAAAAPEMARLLREINLMPHGNLYLAERIDGILVKAGVLSPRKLP